MHSLKVSVISLGVLYTRLKSTAVENVFRRVALTCLVVLLETSKEKVDVR